MVIVMQKHASDTDIEHVVAVLSERGFDVHRSTGSDQTVLGVVGDVASVDPREFEVLHGVQEAVRVSEPYKLSSRSFRREKTVVKVRDISIGGSDVVVMAGPCTIENERQLFETARRVARAGARVLRGGAYKPRTSPYAFQGMGVEGLKLLRAAGDENNMATISEVMEISQIEAMLEYVDILQVGARNMQNYNLLSALGQIRKPILLKRGMSATIQEWLLASEYILSGGNYDVILCERGMHVRDLHAQHARHLRHPGHQQTLPPPDHRRPIARRRPPRQSDAPSPRDRRRRRRRRPDRSAPRARESRLRRPPIALPRPVRKTDGRTADHRPRSGTNVVMEESS